MNLKALAAAIILIASLAGCGGTSAPNAPTTTAVVTGADVTDPTTLTNNGWKITTFAMKADGAGNFGATARIENTTGSEKKAAAFTVTIMDTSKNVVTVLKGVASSIAKDATVTVEFVSTDPYKAGTYLYAFQVDAL